MGAVRGANAFLKIGTHGATKPPIAPSAIHGPATAGSSAPRTWDHTHAAGTTTRNNRNAALFTVPSSVMGGAVGSRCASTNVFALRAGLDVRIRAIAPLSLRFEATTYLRPEPKSP